MIEIVLHTGSNIGNRKANLAKANYLIEHHIGKIKRSSAFYETEAWGYKNQDDFLNQALLVETNLAAEYVLNNIHRIEQNLGRIRGEKWRERSIDIDILFYGKNIIKLESLTIPHKHLESRNFVLIPLNEILPNFIHPVSKKKVSELLRESTDNSTVKKWTQSEA